MDPDPVFFISAPRSERMNNITPRRKLNFSIGAPCSTLNLSFSSPRSALPPGKHQHKEILTSPKNKGSLETQRFRGIKAKNGDDCTLNCSLGGTKSVHQVGPVKIYHTPRPGVSKKSLHPLTFFIIMSCPFVIDILEFTELISIGAGG